MPQPLLLFLNRPKKARRPQRVRKPRSIQQPAHAIFIVMRQMRAPIISLVLIFTVSVSGFALIPGQDESGNATSMSVFDAFYFVLYTAATIGYGEIEPLTTAQRMWGSASILALVVGWAYALGVLLSLLQSATFQEALRFSRFRRKVQRLREPFVIVMGYGRAGAQVCQGLDQAGIRTVVLDKNPQRIADLAGAQLYADSPALVAGGADTGTLTAAGLHHPMCTAVVALTDEDDVNLAVAVASASLRPDLQIITRSIARLTTERLRDFSPTAIINPFDRFGEYLLLAMRRPHVYQLVAWLMSPEDSPLPRRPHHLEGGTWFVCGQGGFARHVSADLSASGMQVHLTDPNHVPLIRGAAGFIAGTPSDTVNLALAEHARGEDAEVFIAVRQRTDDNLEILRAIGADALFVPTDLIAAETLARVVTPIFWSFVEYAFEQSDEWGKTALTDLREACGHLTPARELVTISAAETPAVWRRLQRSTVTLRDLMRDPDDRTVMLTIRPLQLIRDDKVTQLPDLDEHLTVGDQLLLAGHGDALARLLPVLDNDVALTYVTTGQRVASSWIWRALTRQRAARLRRRRATS